MLFFTKYRSRHIALILPRNPSEPIVYCFGGIDRPFIKKNIVMKFYILFKKFESSFIFAE